MRTRLWIVLATFVGLGAAIWAFGSAGLTQVLSAAERIGVGGFLLYCLYSLAVFPILGGAWISAAPGVSAQRVPLFAWARMVREAASDILPFSQVGGIVLGTRILTARGIAAPLVYAALIVEMTTEMAGQLIFTLFGIIMLALTVTAGVDSVLLPILAGTGLMAAMLAAFLMAQRYIPALGERLGERMIPGVAEKMAETGILVRRIYEKRGRVAASFLFNLAGWIASAAGAWIALRLMDVNLPLWAVLTLESLIFALRSVAFIIPGAIGVQEAAYVLIGPLLGLPPESALALSLAKRARDLALGIPALIGWQASELGGIAATKLR
ncbi:HpnL family protein [Stakelama sediminis]|uniref:Putative membrane protein n=1 Tax=Stakelama sediminis TaxID=463200 RepID=A0A840Z1Q6_9SPHN|nr:lysylphosphatidylglycerol synthase domain-containing protein [Stakelama sediminis]MBB5719646.1 putative membrane protein [Stakelama sediminis]